MASALSVAPSLTPRPPMGSWTAPCPLRVPHSIFIAPPLPLPLATSSPSASALFRHLLLLEAPPTSGLGSPAVPALFWALSDVT